MKTFISIFILLICSVELAAQSDTTAFQKDLDKILEDITAEKESSQLYDMVEYLKENPIRINFATEDNLLQIPFVNREDAKMIIKQRKTIGGFYTEETFKDIDGVASDVIDKILPFIDFSRNKGFTLLNQFSQSIKSLTVTYRSRVLRDLQQDRAYLTGKYYGSDLKIYNRLVLNNKNDIHAGIIVEKDAGEKSLTDFNSFHLSLQNLGFVQNIIFGDYSVGFGQGIALWSRSSMSKGSETVDVLPRDAHGIKPYLSTDENIFFKGVAAKTVFDNFSLYTFYSDKYLDGTIDSTTNQIRSLVTDGLHRNASEAAHKHIINEKSYGASLNYDYRDIFGLGILCYTSKFGNDFEKETALDPSGNTFDYLSSCYNLKIGKLYFSGETAYSNKSVSTINSAQITIDKNFALVFSYRNYSKDYWSFHANGFGEKDGTQNESGFYTGIHWRTAYGIFDVYYDQFRFPYAANNFLFPSQGNDFLVYYTLRPFKSGELRLKYRIKSKDDVAALKDQLGLIKGTTENYRAELLYRVLRNVQLRTRVEIVNVHSTTVSSSEKGFLMYQEVQFSPIRSLGISARVVLFKTDSYNSRVYEYESDLAGVMTTPPLYGDGMRWYLLARYNTPFGFTLTFKYAESFKPSETSFGSGATFVNGNLDNRVSLQIDFKM